MPGMLAITPAAGRPKKAQLAAAVLARIVAGEFPPGAAVPSGPALAAEYQVSRATADAALNLLAAQGVVERVPGVGTIVTAQPAAARVVRVPAGARVWARMPEGAERDRVAPGTPVLVIEVPGEETRVLAADQVVLEVG